MNVISTKSANITETQPPYIGSPYKLTQEDSTWIISNAFIIFTMQTGFGMLESGCVSVKNEVNIMMKNVADIVLGGFSWWFWGFGMAFGMSEPNNPFVGIGAYFVDPPIDNDLFGQISAAFFFQLSFATTSTTIVSGAMAERCNFKAYCLFSFLNTIVYCLPAGWVWGDHGFLNEMGAVDIAGSATVHLVGGVSAFACAIMLGPRLGRYDHGYEALPLGCPVNALMGLFVLWWGWLAFNSGSTYGVSGQRWKYAARAAVSTMFGSMGGGLVGLGFSLANPKGIDVLSQINGILGALVSITGGCFLFNAWESILVGMIGGFLTCFTMPLIDRLKIDDPVGASATHGVSGIWGALAIGLFADDPVPLDTTKGRKGLFKGGGWGLLGVQSLTVVCLTSWSFFSSIILLWIVDKIVPLRMSVREELIGADLFEHRVRHTNIGVSRALSALHPMSKKTSLVGVPSIGTNPGHEAFLIKFSRKRRLDKLRLFRRKSPKVNTESTPVDNVKNISSILEDRAKQSPSISKNQTPGLIAWTN